MSAEPKPAPAALVLVSVSLLAAIGWMLFRVFVGLDFTDEMQYYGQIVSLARTGRFFQSDLFVQQLGYFWVIPFFKLHALLFPGQDYLILAGRLLLLGGYGLAGWLFWRAATRVGGFSVVARLAGLATLFAWIPFQIFAPSYNTMAYLLIVGLVATGIDRDEKPRRRTMMLALLLTLLVVVYPPAGLLLGGLLAVDIAVRQGWRAACVLMACTTAGAAAVVAGMVILHGRGFPGDLWTAVQFSHSLSTGRVIQNRYQMIGLLILLAAGGLFIWRVLRGAPLRCPPGVGSASVRGLALALFALAGALLLTEHDGWIYTFASIAGFGFLLLLVAASVGKESGPPGADSIWRMVTLGTLTAGGVTLLWLSVPWFTGYFAISVYLLLLVALAVSAETGAGRPLAELALVAAVLGAIFALSSGNGLHNFGVGAAGLYPFLVLHCARQFERPVAGVPVAFMRQVALPVLVLLFLLNGMRHPYREEMGLTGFLPVRGVPAFAGLRTSPEKIEAINRFSQLYRPATLEGLQVLVVGPQPWLYFASGGRPATPMLFMHFDGGKADELIARALFDRGEPEVVFVTAPLPPPVHAAVARWIEQGCTARMIKLPRAFKQAYEIQTGYLLAEDILLLRREPKHP